MEFHFFPETGGHKQVTVERPKVRRFRDRGDAARAWGKERGLTGAGGGYIAYAGSDGEPTADREFALATANRLRLGIKGVRMDGSEAAYWGVSVNGRYQVAQGWDTLGEVLVIRGSIRPTEDGRFEFTSRKV